MTERATELEYLRYYVQHTNVHSSVVEQIQNSFIEEKGKRPPEGWDHCVYCGYPNLDCVCP